MDGIFYVSIIGEQDMIKKLSRVNVRFGAAAVEMALVTPLLVLLVMGTIDIGRLLMCKSALEHAARDAVRQIAIDGGNDSVAIIAINKHLESSGISNAAISIEPKDGVSVVGQSVRVQVAVEYADASWLGKGSPFASKLLSGSATMRSERIKP